MAAIRPLVPDSTSGIAKQLASTDTLDTGAGARFADGSIIGSAYGPRGLPTGAIAATFPRWAANNGSSVNGVSGQLKVSLLWLEAGQVVSNLGFVAANTGSTTLTHSVAGLYSSSQTAPALLATSTDVTTATWTANTARTYAMGTPYTVLTSGFFYAAIVLTWTSAGPTFYVQNAGQGTGIAALAPITGGTCDSGLTTTLPNPAAAPTVNANQMYVYVT